MAEILAEKPIWSLEQIVANLTRTGAGWPTNEPVTYYFRLSVPYVDPDFLPFNEAQQADARLAMALWSDVSGLRMVEASQGQFVFSQNLRLATPGAAHFGSVQINERLGYGLVDPTVGEYSFYVLLHEIGHGLALPHPGEYENDGRSLSYAADARYAQDTRQYTTMSYWSESFTGADFKGQWPESPMIHDIAAMQAKYGVNTTTRTGDTVYGFNATADRAMFDFRLNPDPVLAIWDAGGTDTIDLSGYTQGAVLNLQGGSTSDVGGLKGNLGIAFGAVIENALGGSGADRIVGNEANNDLRGGAGDDTLLGGGRHDAIHGNRGADVVEGGDGDDSLWGGQDDDRLSGGAGADYALGDFGADAVLGDGGDDILSGGEGSDTVQGGEGRDQVFGGPGDDIVDGGPGDDFAAGDDGRDLMRNSGGRDLIFGGGGDDTVQGGADGDILLGNMGADLLTGGVSADTLYGGQGNDTLAGGLGNDEIRGDRDDDQLFGEGGDDTLSGGPGMDQLRGGAGNDRFLVSLAGDSAVGSADRILDFVRGEDLIDISGIDADTGTAMDDAFAFVASFSLRAGQAVLTFDVAANVTTLRGDVNGDGAPDFELLIGGQLGVDDGWVL